MKQNGLYIEIPIQAEMDALWEHTQNPHKHQVWDLRFTSIEYLPKPSAEAPQQFLYTTQIGFGLKLSGAGESKGKRHQEDGKHTSSLKFWSDEWLSLIQSGSGYWQYIPNGDHIRYLTWYNYETRFGVAGKLIDRFLFRPVIGWATALSFSALRHWLEKDIYPTHSFQHFATFWVCQWVLGFIWIYQGLVPKLLAPHSGELAILPATGLFAGNEPTILLLMGIAEILFGCLFFIPTINKNLHKLNIVALVGLAIGALISQATLFVAPFNPLTVSLAMIALSLISLFNREPLISARHCLRRAP